MKNYNETTYRKEIKKEVLGVFAKFQQSSTSGTFNNDHTINLIHTNYITWERIKNKSLNSYIKYNSHIKEIGKGIDSQLTVSDELFNDVNAVCKKYNINLGLTGMVDLCSDAIFKNRQTGYLSEEFDKGFNTYKVLSLKEELANELVINEAPRKKVNKI